MKKSVSLALLVLAALAAVAPGNASGQRRLDSPPPAPFLVAGRVGFDTRTTEDPIAGAMVRIPVPIPIPGRVALQAAGDLTFLDGLTERQLALDLLYDLGGLSLAAGPVFRNSIWRDPNASPGSALTGDRETRTGFSFAVGVGGGLGRDSAVTIGLEYRLIWIDDYRPRPLMFWVGVAPSRLF